jgi:Phosphoenolpyruvate synthase/pyruvate phosphate dikinase
MYLLDQTWLPFSNLMLKHIYNVLLVCSDYDRFMLEEDGRVEEELYKEYTNLGLSTPPKITHTNSEAEALQLISGLHFDLVITMLDLGSGRVEVLAEEIKKLKPSMPVIALAPSPDHRKARELKGENCPYIDYLFYWQGNPALFLAMVKLIEDSMNIEHDTKEADVQVIILVEDSVRFISSYLPQIYTVLIQQNRNSILEALNEWGKTLRMRGRPKIVLARNYDEAWSLWTKYGENVLGVITDVSFPARDGREKAGLHLARTLRKEESSLPILIQSTDKELEKEAREIDADFVWKLSDHLLQKLEEHIVNNYKFGPFAFLDPITGRKIAEAGTMKELQHQIAAVPIESFIYHSSRNDFSRWLRGRSLYHLASLIKGVNVDADHDAEATRTTLYNTIKQYRAERARSAIAEFSKDNYDETLFFSRIGKGSLGGKGRGLAFIAMEMEANNIARKHEEVYLSIPRTVVITTEIFDRFLKLNGLDKLTFLNDSDSEILRLFLSGKLPEDFEEDLKVILSVISSPMSIRSSSLLEDSHSQPFAGVYQTSMIPNTGSEKKRLRELSDAIKTVWASTYFECAKEYQKSTGHSVSDEKMAVIIQQVTGSAHGDYWFPNISGVARSLNYYPAPGIESEDGIGMIAFGFGKTIVDEGTALRFCPAKPKKPAGDLKNQEASRQDSFYALNLTLPFDPEGNIDNLEPLPLSYAEKYPKSLKHIATTLDLSTGAMSESAFAEGLKILTFNGILKYDALPLAKIVDDILKLGQSAMSEPVEIEFAVNTERAPEKKTDFSILQIRPISGLNGYTDVKITEKDKENALVYSNQVMGNGTHTDIHTLITLKPETFRVEEMLDMASELSQLNGSTGDEYILIAAGRLGSTDRYLGIPCTWSDISRARVIVETGLDDFQVEPSQGTHFFQNMTSLGCIYLTVNEKFNNGFIDFERLGKLPLLRETKHFLMLQAEDRFTVKANGLEKTGIIAVNGGKA